MNRNLLLATFFLATLSIAGCKKSISPVEEMQKTLIGDKVAPDGFAYKSTKEVTINIRLLNDKETPLKGVMVKIYNPDNIGTGRELTKVISNSEGYARTKVTVPSSIQNFIVDAQYFGLLRNVSTYASNNIITAIIGGKNVKSGNINTSKISYATPDNFKLSVLTNGVNGISSKTVFDYDPKKFDELGRPNEDRLSTPDNIDFNALKALINNSLPESKYIADKFIATEAPSNLSITALADVWITFVHEGADYRNAFGFYTFPTGHPPVDANDIDSVHMIFPNASLKGHNGAGNMLTGDKVKIGRFKAGTSIAFVLIQNSYNDDKTISTNNTTFYSNEYLNPEEGKLQRHNVLLNHAAQSKFLIGFEDIDRRLPGCDHDFNDLVVYAQSNPVEAISPKDIPFLEEKIVDTDGDGVPDDRDVYPKDKDRAYDRYYPSELTWGTTAFEDLWPNEGDYDLNDLVVNYRYKFAMSATNNVADLTAEYTPLAAGASQKNGFGVQLPISSDAISKVSGSSIKESYLKLAGNGTEAGQEKAVIIPFDNFQNLFNGTYYINTLPGSGKLTGETVKLYMQFTSPLSDDFTALAPFNPFMISGLDRGREVHLVNKAPTDLVNLKTLGTGSDTSDPKTGRYYVTANNKPFGIDIYGTFSYPQEKINISQVFTHFDEWAKSGGYKYDDWYSDKDGYINKKLIYPSGK